MQGLSELRKMLDCCGPVRANKREVAKLVLAVLAGMTSRQIINKCSDDEIDPDDKRAPLIVVGKREGRWDALRLIVESLQVKVDSKKERKQQAADWIEMKCPPVISSPNGSTTTGEKAYAVLHVREDTFDVLQEATWKAYPLPLPAQYRDAAVLLYRSHFERNLIPFIQLNRWVTIVLYGGSGSSLPLDPMGFDAGCMRMFEPDWDAEEV